MDTLTGAMSAYTDELRVALSIAAIVAIALVARGLIWRVVRPFFRRVVRHASTVEEKRRLETVGRIARQSLSVLILVLAGTLVLAQLGVSIAPILGAAGVVGIAVGFGAQSLVKDLFSGFFLLVENQIRVGDVVEIAGKSGSVEELSLRRTKLRAYDGSVHYISNGLITTVTNLSTEFAYAVVDVQVPYDQDVERVYQWMRQAAEALRASPDDAAKVLGDLEIAGVEQLGDTWMLVRARLKTPPLEQWSVRRRYLECLKHTFAREGRPLADEAASASGIRLTVGKALHEEGAGPVHAAKAP